MKNIFVFDGKLSIVCRRNSKSHERKFLSSSSFNTSFFHSVFLPDDGRKREEGDAKERRKTVGKKMPKRKFGDMKKGKKWNKLSIFSYLKFLMQKILLKLSNEPFSSLSFFLYLFLFPAFFSLSFSSKIWKFSELESKFFRFLPSFPSYVCCVRRRERRIGRRRGRRKVRE